MTRLRNVSCPPFKPLLTIGVVTVAAVTATLAGPGATAAPIGRIAAAPTTGQNSELYGVTVAPKSTDAWVLAFNWMPSSPKSGDAVLHRHNGRWSKVPVKGAATKSSTYLNGVAAASTKQIWVVGDHVNTSTSTYTPVIAKSTGGRFKPVALKGFKQGRLIGVAASSTSNTWVIGETADFANNIAFHWNGKRWRKVALPPSMSGAFDRAVVSTSGPNDTWVLGSGSETTIEHWNGHTWSEAPLPNASDVGQGIATSAGHAWLAGYATTSSGTKPLALRWNGSAWKPVRLAHGARNEIFEGVTALGSSAYAVGRRRVSSSSNNATPIVAKLHGTKGRIRAAVAAGKYSTLVVAAASTKSVLAVGDYETKDYCTSPFHALAETIVHANWARLKIPAKLVPASKSGQADCA